MLCIEVDSRFKGTKNYCVKQGVVVHTCNHSIGEVEAGGL
jgi:hypothetical protein